MVARTGMVVVVVALSAAIVFGGCGGSDHDGSTSAPAISAATTEGKDPTADARLVLERLFEAWSAKDAATAASFVSAERGGVTWEFATLDRVEFGPITPDPDAIPGYIEFGLGSVTGAAAGDVRCFRATATFHYAPGSTGAAPEGEEMDWSWFLERDAEGTWLVTDWGY